MKWSEFTQKVNDLLAVERRRLGVQQSIDQWIRLGLGDVQRLIDYYRKGITSTYEFDDLERDGHSSKARLPRGANLREAYHVKTGTLWVRRPLYEYTFANRNDLRAGVVNIESQRFLIAIDHRENDFWVYPRITTGYAVQIVWDAVVGRTDHEYSANDEVPFDEPVAQLVYDYVKMRLAREIDKDRQTASDYELSYRKGINALYQETQERLRLKHDISPATCIPQACCDTVPSCGQCNNSPCGCVSSVLVDGYCGNCPEIVLPQAEWVMTGDSGERVYISDTIAVASAIRALDPQFVFHMGDWAYATSRRPGDVGTPTPVGQSSGGAAHLLYDLFLKHYWNFKDGNLYLAFGNHDLETGYGAPTLNVIPTVANLIGSANRQSNLLMYEFARGPVRFFVLNSGLSDSDVNIQIATQTAWLQQRVPVAAEPWLVVVFHRPAYSSDSNHHPGSTLMRNLTNQLPSLGIDLVVNAHAHNYERFLDSNGLPHVICGLAGAAKRGTANPLNVIGSQFFYNEKNGFLHFKADADTLQWAFRTVDNEVIDMVTLKKTDGVTTGGGGPQCDPVTITSNPSGQSVQSGVQVTFSVAASGTSPMVYQWFKNGVAIQGETSATYTIASTQQSDSATYTVTVSNACGSMTSSAAALTVAAPQFAVYHGKNVNQTLTEPGILALTTTQVQSIPGSYQFAAGTGYAYFAFPASKPAPTAINVGFSMALAGAAEGYAVTTNGLTHALVAVNGQSYRVYRSYYQLNGGFTATVQ